VGVYYRPPDPEEEADEAFYRQLKVASQSQALLLMGDFNHPDISWEDHTARQAKSRRFVQNIDDNFLMQVVEEPTGKGTLLDSGMHGLESGSGSQAGQRAGSSSEGGHG